MDPLTHLVTGALVAQSLAPEEHRWLTSLVAAGAAVVPDLDFLARKAPARLLFLRLHRGLTHSLLALQVIGACAAGTAHLLFGLPFWPTFGACALAALTHAILDAVMHSTGLQLLWPWSRRLTLPLLIGLNPLTSSARCAERSLNVCLRCTMHSAVLSPLVLLLWAGLIISLPLSSWRLVSQLTLAAAMGYLLLAGLLRLRARALLAAQLGGGRVVGIYPAGFSPSRWLGLVAEPDGEHALLAVDALRVKISPHARFAPPEQGAKVELTRRTPTVAEFLNNAIAPHVSLHANVVVWRDLAYAFSPSVSLFAVRVELEGQQIRAEEFRERWDHPPERP